MAASECNVDCILYDIMSLKKIKNKPLGIKENFDDYKESFYQKKRNKSKKVAIDEWNVSAIANDSIEIDAHYSGFKSSHNRDPTPFPQKKNRKVDRSRCKKRTLDTSYYVTELNESPVATTSENKIFRSDLNMLSSKRKKRKRDISLVGNSNVDLCNQDLNGGAYSDEDCNIIEDVDSFFNKFDTSISDDDEEETSDNYIASTLSTEEEVEDNYINIDENLEIIEDDVQQISSDDDTPIIVKNSENGKALNKKKKKKTKCKQTKQCRINELTLISLKPDAEIYMYGLATVKVLHGAVEMLGYVLDKNCDEVEVFSPRGTAFLYMKSSITTASKNNESGLALPDEIKESQILVEEHLDFTPNSTVILCRNLMPTYFNFLEKHIAQTIIPKTVTSRSCLFRERYKDWNVIKKNYSWDIFSKITFTSKVFICGGKGVGKSTLMRYLINSLLKKFKEICVVDLDPGQPEFTVPGCISTTVVSEPIFGPNYTHLQKPDQSIFVSNINIEVEPDVYLLNVKELLNNSKDLMQLPTIINYMGYHRGLGIDLAASVINLVEPSLVIQIESKNVSNNFKQTLNVENVKQKSQSLSLYINNLSYKLITVPSMSDENTGWKLSAREVRELCILSYFGKNLKEATSILNCEVPIYIIDLSEIQLRIDNRDASVLEINGRLVGLCSLQNKCDITDVYACHGWGIVRGVDPKTNKLALITPVSPNTLEDVHYLVVGSVGLPASVYMSQVDVDAVGFVSTGVSQFTSNIPKKKHFPQKM